MLHAMFREAAARWPESMAVATPARCLTYRELDDLSERLAARLRRRGAGPGDLVAVSMEKGWEQVVAVLGTLKAGAAYLPVDPGLPAARFDELLTRAAVRHLLGRPDPTAPVPDRVEVLAVDAGLATARLAHPPPPEPASRQDLAYVLFTSGSTGTPKGVMIEHRGVVNTVRDLNRRFRIGPGDRFLGLSSLSFDMSVYDIFGALIAGAAVVLPDPADVRDPAGWLALMRRFGVTVWNSVPGLLAMLVSWLEATTGSGPAATSADEGLAELRLAFLGGDWIPLDLPERARAFFEGLRIVNIGGATEASICSCLFEVDRVDPAWASIPYGRALSGQFWRILDPDLRPCPPAVPGDLYIGGIGLARGYLNDPERTAEAFIRHPDNGERLYRTGDRGRWLPDGNIEFLGRADHQVKVRGHRVELGEVEAHAQQHPAVRQAVAVAVAVGRSPMLDRIVLFVTTHRGVAAELELPGFLAGRLPGYLLPDHCRRLDPLPLTGNGKVDRARLRELARTLDPDGGASPDPRGETERRVAELWQELLPAGRVGRDSDFFELGGNSLLAAQLAGRIRRAFDADDVTGAFAFHATTVAAMARALDRPAGARRSPHPDSGPASPAADSGPGLTFGQEQLWFFDQLGAAGRAYQFQASIRFSGRLDVAALRYALTEVVARHEVLRTTYLDRGHGPEQWVHPPYQVALEVEDLRGVPAADREPELRRAIEREIARPFDLARLPLIRWRLYRTGDQDWTLTEVEHHIVHDGWSVALLWREVGILYRARQTGQEATLPQPEVQMRGYARRQRERFRRRAPQVLGYWRRQLAELPPLDLPIAGRRPARQEFAGRSRRVTLDPELYRRLRAFSQAHGCSLYVVMLAGFAILLHRYTNQTDIPVGSWLANRQDPEAEHLIGMLVNMVVLRNQLDPDESVAATLHRVRGNTVAAFEHQDAPFHEVVRAVDPHRDPSRNPLVQNCFSFHDSPVPEFDWPGVAGHLTEEHNQTAKFDLNVVVVPHAEQRRRDEPRPGVDQLVVIWEYATRLFAAEDVDRMIGHYEQILRGMLADPAAKISELDCRTVGERHRERRWQGPTAAAPGASLPELVRRQAITSPDAVAVQFEDEQMSYRELVALAGRLAGGLRAAGVTRGDLVAVCPERSIELVAHLLAVLAIGAGYLPLDPAHPAPRNRQILATAQPAAVVADQPQAGWLAGTGAPVLAPEQLRTAPDAEYAPVATPEDRAYVLFTSGSTGRPKGVEVVHRSVVNLLWDMRTRLAVRPDDTLLALTTISFDISVLELFLPLLAGARVDLGSDRLARRPAAVVDRLDRTPVTILQATPTMWRLLLAAGAWRERERLIALCGGETFSTDLAASLAARCTQVWNLYGPTETTIWSTAHRLTREGDSAGRPVPIGWPIANTRCHVLNSAGIPQPVGIPGELHIGGTGVASGYLRSPELTARRFRPAGAAAGPAERLFATGDLVRRRASGELEFLGRADTQVKIRGVRVELSEVEAVLRSCPAVRDAAATTVVTDGPAAQLVGYVELTDPATATGPDLASIRLHVRSRLPAAMVPDRLVPVDRLPTTPSGKVDRRRLAAPPAAGLPDAPAAAPPPAAPAAGPGHTEQLLAGIFAEVLETDRVDHREDFFELGGHSLLALRLAQRLREELKVEVGLEVIFDHGSVAELATVLDRSRR